jgi:hypothetical protein
VLDYRTLGVGASVTINPAGRYEKTAADGVTSLGADTVGLFTGLGLTDFFDLVIAPEDGQSTVNGTNVIGGVAQDASVTVNLAAGTVAANETDPNGAIIGAAFGFDIQNFVNASGSTNDDILIGDAEDNDLFGNEGDDDIRGRGGDDVINAGAGQDNVTGGGGVDTFVFDQADAEANAGDGIPSTFTRVLDFGTDDLVDLTDFGFANLITAGALFTAADNNTTQNGVNARLNGDGTRIVLRTDGDDGGSSIDNDEIFARLIIDPNDFLSVA